MSPDPDHPIELEAIPYFSGTWCSLPWSPWVPFSATKEEFRTIPKAPGLYRIRPAGKNFLMYIGGTGRTLHQRLNNLRMELRNPDLMPWSDLHAEAPGLWSWADDQGYDYECSAAPLDVSAVGRKGMECFLLYRYRQERGRSPLCNFGRFHPRYRKSTERKDDRRGGKLGEDQKNNPAGGPGLAPLEPVGSPGEPGWMGLVWTEREPLDADHVRNVPAGAGLYLLADAALHEIVYIGQSEDLAGRLRDHSGTVRDDRPLEFSCRSIGQPALPHILREVENDLIGNFFEQFRKTPEFQFRNQPL